MNEQRILYDELSYFYSTITEDQINSPHIRARMGSLVRKARMAMPENANIKQQIQHLLQLVYIDWGFHCDPNHYFRAENLFLPYVLDNHTGSPASIGGILLYLANRLKLPLYPISFPNQLILRAEWDNEVVFIDPWDGSYISKQALQKLYEGTYGFGVEMKSKDLSTAKSEELRERFQQLAKSTLIREDFNDLALIYIDALLNRKNDPYDIRDRGIVFAKMGCFQSAVDDLEYFVEQCPDDPTTFLLKAQLGELKNELKQNTYPLH